MNDSFSDLAKSLPPEIRERLIDSARRAEKPNLEATAEAVRAAHRPDAISEMFFASQLQTREGRSEGSGLSPLEELFLELLKLPTGAPLQDPDFATAQTIHEGRAKYAPMWNYYIRLKGGRVDVRFGDNFFKNVSGLRTIQMNALRDIILSQATQQGLKKRGIYRDALIVWYVWCFLRDNHHR